MIRKIQFISDKLGATRNDVWECEMLYKLIHEECDPATENYLRDKFLQPYLALKSLLSNLYSEALHAA